MSELVKPRKQTFSNAAVIWRDTYLDWGVELLQHGKARPSRDGDTLDLGPVMIECTQPPPFTTIAGRGGKAEFALAEQLTYLAGVNQEALVKFAPSYERFSYPGQNGNRQWPGAYGPRLLQGLPFAVKVLTDSPDSRQAVVHIHNHQDLVRAADGGVKATDIPCTLQLIFDRSTDGKLQCHAMMRSTDFWFGLYYDLPAFAFLQYRVAECLGWEVGAIRLTTNSLHLYTKHVNKVQQLRATGRQILDELHPEVPWYRGEPIDGWRKMFELSNRAKHELEQL